jgi:MFS family permease
VSLQKSILESQKGGTEWRGYLTASLVILAFFLMKLGQFLIMPFMAIYLTQFTSLTPLFIGLIIASGQLGYSLLSLCSGHLLDRYCPQKVLITTLLSAGIVYECLYEVQSLVSFTVFNLLIGMIRALFDNASKTLLVVNVDNQLRNSAFNLRYLILNLAAALGPLLGANNAVRQSSELFFIIASCNLFIGILSLWILPKKRINFRQNSEQPTSMRHTLFLIKTNAPLRILFSINFLYCCLYAQITSTLAQYLDKQFDQGVAIYSELLILNALICALFQLSMGCLFQKLSWFTLARIGLVLLALGFGGFCFAHNLWELSVSMLILSLGELILFPLNDLLLAKIAPCNLVGSYYGVLNASLIGLGIGPILGGGLYQMSNHFVLFLTCALSSLYVVVLYKKLIKCLPS